MGEKLALLKEEKCAQMKNLRFRKLSGLKICTKCKLTSVHGRDMAKSNLGKSRDTTGIVLKSKLLRK